MVMVVMMVVVVMMVMMVMMVVVVVIVVVVMMVMVMMVVMMVVVMVMMVVVNLIPNWLVICLEWQHSSFNPLCSKADDVGSAEALWRLDLIPSESSLP